VAFLFGCTARAASNAFNMTLQIAFILILLVVALVVLAIEMLPIEQVALLLTAVLAASGIINAQTAFQGFASETVVMLACVMVLSRRLTDSGLLARLSAQLKPGDKPHPRRTGAWLMTVSASLSSVVTNTSTTAVLTPVVLEIARRIKVHPGRFLMPVAFASMMGGSATLIGTSTNLAASGVLSRLGLAPFGVFEFALVGITVSIAGIILLTVLGPWLLPTDLPDDDDTASREKPFMATFVVPAGSPSIGKSVSELGLETFAVTALAVSRKGGRVTAHPRRKLLEADQIILRGSGAALVKIASHPLFGFEPDTPTPRKGTSQPILAEVILMPGARWLSQSVNAARAEIGPDLRIMALHRHGQTTAALVDRMRLKTGDILLLQGARDRVEALERDPDLSLLLPPQPAPPTPREGIYTLSALLCAIAAGTTGLLPFSVALLLAVLTLVLTGRFSLQDMFGMISWRILILIGGMSSFGVAMQVSGTASWLATVMLFALEDYGSVAVLLGLGLLTILLTQPMSNAAAALTLLPVAIAVAEQLGADPRPFAVMVTLSASLSFVAPFEPALLLVYGPGQYKLRDFMRAGLPVTLLSLGILLVMVPILWPLGID
jgi:di/tricarboxylate transporter